MVTILWSVCGTAAIALAAVCGWLGLTEQRDRASLMLCLLGIAAAGSSYFELALMHSASAEEYAELQRWYHVPIFLGFISLVLFVPITSEQPECGSYGRSSSCDRPCSS